MTMQKLVPSSITDEVAQTPHADLGSAKLAGLRKVYPVITEESIAEAIDQLKTEFGQRLDELKTQLSELIQRKGNDNGPLVPQR